MGSLFHLLAPLEQTFHLSFHLVHFQGNAGTNIRTISHALTDEHTQAGVRNMKLFSVANCEIHLDCFHSCVIGASIGPDGAVHLKKNKP